MQNHRRTCPLISRRAFSYQAFCGNGLLSAPCGWPETLELPKQSFILDRDKGLQNATKQFPDANHSYCCWHLAKNVQENHGKKAQGFFWKLVYASESQFPWIFIEFKRECGQVSIDSFLIKIRNTF
jgi:hypothetical protein